MITMIRKCRWMFVLAVVFCGSSLMAVGQSDTITANPKAVLLHRIWMLRGSVLGQEMVGDAAGGIGDIDGDGKTEFAVAVGKLGQWRVFAGRDSAPSSEPVWQFTGSLFPPSYPIVGDFWGTGHNAVGFGTVVVETINNTTRYYPQIKVFRTESGKLPDTPSAMFYPRKTLQVPVDPGYNDVLVGDLDGDGADEMIVVIYRLYRNGIESSNAEFWIFKGGPQFQLDTPTVILRDPEANNDDNLHSAIGDFDGDGHLDILTTAGYRNSGPKLKVYWGSSSTIESWADPATVSMRSIAFDEHYPTIGYGLTTLDCDGDGIKDIMLGSNGGPRLFRSRTGKSLRTRRLDTSDADFQFRKPEFETYGTAGYLTDPQHRYEMPVIFGPSPSRQNAMMLAFSSGPDGPDRQYDAYYAGDLDTLIPGNVFQFERSIGDCNGDGWDDFLTANYSWYGNNAGIALVLAGGPYIPHDSTTVGIHDVVVAGVRNAVSIWPMPARDELHIAWRGDLKRMPSRFTVHDILGRTIATGSVESWRGEAIWQCATAPPGAYLLSIFDEHDVLITTTRVIKQ